MASNSSLNNITIKKLQDKNFNDYYLIVNNNNKDEVYFCFEKAVKEGWGDLVSGWEQIKEVELEFETNERGNNKVVSLYAIREGNIVV